MFFKALPPPQIALFFRYLDHCRIFLLVGTLCSSGSSTSSASDSSSLSEVSTPPYKLSFIPAPDLRLLKLSFVGLLELLPNSGFRFWSNLADLLVLVGSWTSALGLVFSMMMSAACSSKCPIKKSVLEHYWNVCEKLWDDYLQGKNRLELAKKIGLF